MRQKESLSICCAYLHLSRVETEAVGAAHYKFVDAAYLGLCLPAWQDVLRSFPAGCSRYPATVALAISAAFLCLQQQQWQWQQLSLCLLRHLRA